MSTQTAAAGNPSALADIWSEPGASRIPARVYTSPEVYARELERIFYGRHWSYVGLAAEVPEPGSFKRTSIGERSVIGGNVWITADVPAGAKIAQERPR